MNFECFGKNKISDNCKNCIYLESCDWASRHPIGSCRLGFSEFSSVTEAIHWEHLCIDHPAYEITSCPSQTYSCQHLLRIVSTINTLDKYSLKILARIINNPGTSTKDLTIWRGCSRQSLHEKMVSAVMRYPFLASVFGLTLRRMPKSGKSKIQQIAACER